VVDRREILEAAAELGLQPQVLEKDYVLGWLLAGIYRHERLRSTWVFKGGTCLKKCYFETYRFSEDLDFTLADGSHLDVRFLVGAFSEVSASMYDQTGIEIPADQLRFDVFQNPRGKLSCEGRVYYRGPIAPTGSLPRIKLDLTADEVLLKSPVERAVAHPYSDAPPEGITARCYAFDELFAEKLRALGERARPRDLYDVVNLFRNGEFREAAAAIYDLLRRKCSFKGVPVPSNELLASHREELAADWVAMLRHQLPELPPFQAFWEALPEVFRWLSEAIVPTRPAPIPLEAGETVVPSRAGRLRFAAYGTGSLEIIRFAASNRMCVDLDYGGETRRIEPYSLRETRDGNVILHAVKTATGEHRSYRVDRIQGARATSQTFAPRYAVELTPSGPLLIPPNERSMSITGGSQRWPTWRSSRSTGPIYVYECSLCGKRFRRKTRDSALRDHKAPNGWPCRGRRGIFVDTEY
jgi:predicted nucleotidyltransferase component of viral defense system